MISSFIRIDTLTQTLFLYEDNALFAKWPISTAANGLGEVNDSFKTPRGWHEIKDKIGNTAPINAVFVAREQSGEIFSPVMKETYPDRDWILTRIMRLNGLEPGINQGGGVDSFKRMIYIHGTPADTELGTPGSKGCIRMKNDSIVQLFDRVACNTKVLIQ